MLFSISPNATEGQGSLPLIPDIVPEPAGLGDVILP